MSYRILYRSAVIRIPGDQLADGIDRYAICEEMGESNVYENNRRCRSWDCTLLGAFEEVLEDSCYFATGCETGDLKLNGKNISPETYINRVENLMKNALENENELASQIRLSLVFKCEPDSKEDILLSKRGVTRKVQKKSFTSDGSLEVVFQFLDGHENDYRTFFECYGLIKGAKTAGWLFTTCYGPSH